MLSKDELISEAVSLPVDIRLQLVEKFLHSLNPAQKNIDDVWAEEAEKRVKAIENGEIKTIPGETIFQKLNLKPE